MKKSKLLKECGLYDFTDKKTALDTYITYMLARTQSMFDYDGLPETLSKRAIELYLQCNGVVCFAEHKGDLYAFQGGYGGKLDEYYIPTEFTVSSPYLELSKTYTRDKDCIVVNNDSMMVGLLPLFERYASLLLELDISTMLTTVNTRSSILISATDDRSKKSADEFISDLVSGKLSVAMSSEFLEGIKTQPYSAPGDTNKIQGLIELNQYIKASWYNELGLQSNYNMKREAINSNESQLNDDMLKPLIDDMEAQRKEGIDKVNAMFGTHISVSRGGAWKVRDEEITNNGDVDSSSDSDTDNSEESTGVVKDADDKTE